MATTQPQLLTTTTTTHTTTRTSRVLATIAIVCALLIAVAALATSLIAIGSDDVAPATPPATARSVSASEPTCPVHGFC